MKIHNPDENQPEEHRENHSMWSLSAADQQDLWK